jgi:hypothetical protein
MSKVKSDTWGLGYAAGRYSQIEVMLAWMLPEYIDGFLQGVNDRHSSGETITFYDANRAVKREVVIKKADRSRYLGMSGIDRAAHLAEPEIVALAAKIVVPPP